MKPDVNSVLLLFQDITAKFSSSAGIDPSSSEKTTKRQSSKSIRVTILMGRPFMTSCSEKSVNFLISGRSYALKSEREELWGRP